MARGAGGRERAYQKLSDTQRSHLIGLFIIASQNGNKVPLDMEWLQHELCTTTPIDFKTLVDNGWIEVDASTVLAECEQSAAPSHHITDNSSHHITETLTKKFVKNPPKYPAEFEAFWSMSTKRGSKYEALKVWCALMPHPDTALTQQITAGMLAWEHSEQWQDETKQPHICRWLKRHGWEELVPKSNGHKQLYTKETYAEAKERRQRETRQSRDSHGRDGIRGEKNRAESTLKNHTEI